MIILDALPSVPSVNNTNALGTRTIEAYMQEARDEHFLQRGTDKGTISSVIRLDKLIRKLISPDNMDSVTDETVSKKLRLLRANARAVSTAMAEKHLDNLRNTGVSEEALSRMPSWGEIPNTIRCTFALEIEKYASTIGLSLSKCQKMWGALLLLADITKNRYTKREKPWSNGRTSSHGRGLPSNHGYGSSSASNCLPISNSIAITAVDDTILSPPPTDNSGLPASFHPFRRRQVLPEAASDGGESLTSERLPEPPKVEAEIEQDEMPSLRPFFFLANENE